MLSRNNLFLVILLVAQIVLLAISVATSTGTETKPLEPILQGMSAADVEKMTIADDLENQVTVARGEDGWVLPDADDFPVNGEKVDEILDKIAGMDTRRLVATNPANFARLEVKDDDFRRTISLESAESSTVLYLGGSGGADTVYVRRADENDVYLGVGLNSWELATQTSTWVDANYVSVPQEDVQEITIRNAQGSFTFLRDGENWTYSGLAEDEIFEDTKMPLVLRNAATIRLLEPLGLEALDDYGLAEPQVKVEVRYRKLVDVEEVVEDDEGDGQTADETAEDPAAEVTVEYTEDAYTLTFGADRDDGAVLKSSAAEYYVLVRDTVINAFREISRADLVKAPEPNVGADAAAENG